MKLERVTKGPDHWPDAPDADAFTKMRKSVRSRFFSKWEDKEINSLVHYA